MTSTTKPPKAEYLIDALTGAGMTQDDLNSRVMVKFMHGMASYLQLLRVQNDSADDIKETTLRRGEIALAKRILALTPEVGLESAELDADGMHAADAMAHSAGTVAGVRVQVLPEGGVRLENQP